MRALDRWKESVRPYYLRWCYFPLFPAARPAYFRESWRHLNYPLDNASLAEHRAAPGRTTFLFLPMNDWHARTQRSQHLASALADRGHASFYLNPHLGREYDSVPAARRTPRFGVLRPRLLELHVPLPSEPVYHHRLLRPEESRSLAEAMAPIAADRASVVQVVSLPTWLDAALTLRRRYGWPIVYDCHDFLAGFETMSADIVRAESGMLAEAGHLVFTSQYLRDTVLRGVADHAEARSTVVRNGVDWGLFGDLLDRRPPVNGAQRTVGYFGALEEWFDCDMVAALARRAPHFRIQLLGRVESAAVRRLAAALPNVHLAGETSYSELPAYLTGFDVAVIPFRNTPLTRCADPIKLYEYFAAGLPVVSTSLPELTGHGDLVYLADDPESFADRVLEAAREDSPERRVLRAIAASQSSWEARAVQFERLTLHLLAGASHKVS